MTTWSVVLPSSPELDLLAAALEDASNPFGFHIAAKVGSSGGFKFEIFSDEHGLPHFRVSYSGEVGNYTIKDCTQVNGGLQRHYRKIREWHAANKPHLIAQWDARRPTDCDVGPYREDPSLPKAK